MSLFGSLQTNYSTSPLQTGRLPTVPEGSGEGVGNGGNAFLSLVDAAGASDGTPDGKLSMYSTISPELAYRASLIGSLLEDVTNDVPAIDDDRTVDDLIGDVTPGAAVSFDAVDGEEETNELQSHLADNTLPRADGDEEVGSPIEEAAGAVTNALPRMDAPPA